MHSATERPQKVWRAIAHVAGGSGLAQVVAFAALPVLSRLFSPGGFGAFSLVTAVVALVVSVATLRLESVVYIVRTRWEVRATVQIAITSTVVCAVGACLVVEALIYDGRLAFESLPFASLWIGSLTLLTGLFVVANQLALRQGAYAESGRRSVYVAIATAAAQTTAGALGAAAPGLVAGAVSGRLVGVLTLAKRLSIVSERFSLHAWKLVLRRYWRYPTVFTASSLLNMIGLQMPIIFTGAWFAMADAGQLGMAERLIAVPVTLIGVSAGQVLEAEMARKLRSGEGEQSPRSFYLRASGGLLIVGVLCGTVLFIGAPFAVGIVLGPEWTVAGHLMQIMAVPTMVRIVVAPTSRVLVAMQKSGTTLFLDIFRVIAMAVSVIVILIFDLSLLPAAMWMYGALAVTYIVTWVISLVAVAHHPSTSR